MQIKKVITRRNLLTRGALAAAGVAAAPMFNRGRYQLFASSPTEYSSKSIGLIMFDLTEGLIRRKCSDADIEGILGGNFERVLGEVWSV
jgi:hypothetical protein